MVRKKASAPIAEFKKFSVGDIQQYNGQGGKPAYLIFEGKVYDITESSFWKSGDHQTAHQAGKDLTEGMKIAPHGKEVLDKVKQIGIIV